MADQLFEDRRKALEEAFFKKHNQALLDRLHQAAQTEAAARELARVTGIKDEKILARLAALGFDAASLLAFALVPTVEVAWANGSVDDNERQLILTRVAREIPPGSPAEEMVKGWLARRPARELFEAWVAFTRALCADLALPDRQWLAQAIVGRAEEVAEASGGVFGLVLQKSRSEAEVLRRIEEAFGL